MSKKLNTSIAKIKNSSGEFEPMAALVGQSPYELAVEAGFEGTEQDWLEMMIGNGWIGAFQDLQKADEAMQKVIDKLPETYSTKKEVKDLSDITVPIISNRPPTETDAGVPGKIWTVPHIIFKNLFPGEWTPIGASLEAANGVSTLTGDGTQNTIIAESYLLENYTGGDIIYVKASITSVTASNSILFELLGADNTVAYTETVSVPNASSINVISGYFTSEIQIRKIRITSSYNTAETQASQIISISNIKIVDLTEDMCQSKNGLEFDDENANSYFENFSEFRVLPYQYSDAVWMCRGKDNNNKYIWKYRIDEQKSRSIYLAFVGQVNTNQLDAAFGKNNPDRLFGLGLAMAMYDRFKDPTINIERKFPSLITCQNYDEVIANPYALDELNSCQNLIDLISMSPYAKEAFSKGVYTPGDNIIQSAIGDFNSTTLTAKKNGKYKISVITTMSGRGYYYLKVNGTNVVSQHVSTKADKGTFYGSGCALSIEMTLNAGDIISAQCVGSGGSVVSSTSAFILSIANKLINYNDMEFEAGNNVIACLHSHYSKNKYTNVEIATFTKSGTITIYNIGYGSVNYVNPGDSTLHPVTSGTPFSVVEGTKLQFTNTEGSTSVGNGWRYQYVYLALSTEPQLQI